MTPIILPISVPYQRQPTIRELANEAAMKYSTIETVRNDFRAGSEWAIKHSETSMGAFEIVYISFITLIVIAWLSSFFIGTLEAPEWKEYKFDRPGRFILWPYAVGGLVNHFLFDEPKRKTT